MKGESFDRRVSLLRTEDSQRRRGMQAKPRVNQRVVLSFGSSTKKTVGLLGMRMLNQSLDSLWDTEPKKPIGRQYICSLPHTQEIITAMGLNDKAFMSLDDLLALVLQKADSGTFRLGWELLTIQRAKPRPGLYQLLLLVIREGCIFWETSGLYDHKLRVRNHPLVPIFMYSLGVLFLRKAWYWWKLGWKTTGTRLLLIITS